MAAAQSLDRAVLFTHDALALTKVHYVVEVDRTVLKESQREILVRRLAWGTKISKCPQLFGTTPSPLADSSARSHQARPPSDIQMPAWAGIGSV
jgi:hypothetical protein